MKQWSLCSIPTRLWVRGVVKVFRGWSGHESDCRNGVGAVWWRMAPDTPVIDCLLLRAARHSSAHWELPHLYLCQGPARGGAPLVSYVPLTHTPLLPPLFCRICCRSPTPYKCGTSLCAQLAICVPLCLRYAASFRSNCHFVPLSVFLLWACAVKHRPPSCKP